MVLVKKKGNFYRAVIKLPGILFLLFVGSRQHAPAFSNLRASLLAPTSSQSLYPSPSCANTPRLFPVCRCPCWRRPPREALILRRTAPTRPGFFQSAGVFVGADLSAKPLSFVEPRQHAPAFSGLPVPMLAPTSPQSLCPSPSHANTPRLFPVCRRPCWRLVPRKALSLRPATPTWSGFPRFAGAHVGADLSAKPLSFVEPRQHAPAFSNLPASLLASTSSQSPYPSPNRANTPRLFPTCRRQCWRRPPRKDFILRRATPTPKSIEPEICAIQNERKTASPIPSRSFFTKIRSCRNYSAITVPTQALPVHAALPSSVSR